MRPLLASALAWCLLFAAGALINALVTGALEQTGVWSDRVRTHRFDPLRELRRLIEALLALGLAGALGGRTGWPRWLTGMAVLLLWPLRLLRELTTAGALSRRPGDTLALHERGFLADTYGPLRTRVAVVAVAVAFDALVPPFRVRLEWLAGWAVRVAWRVFSA